MNPQANRESVVSSLVLLLWLVPAALATTSGSRPIQSCSDKVVGKEGTAVTRRVRILEKPNPKRTDEARKHGTEGVVVLSVVLNASKKVTDIKVAQALPHGLTEAAIKEAERIRFEPALKDGCPISVNLTIEYRFSSSD